MRILFNDNETIDFFNYIPSHLKDRFMMNLSKHIERKNNVSEYGFGINREIYMTDEWLTNIRNSIQDTFTKKNNVNFDFNMKSLINIFRNKSEFGIDFDIGLSYIYIDDECKYWQSNYREELDKIIEDKVNSNSSINDIQNNENLSSEIISYIEETNLDTLKENGIGFIGILGNERYARMLSSRYESYSSSINDLIQEFFSVYETPAKNDKIKIFTGSQFKPFFEKGLKSNLENLASIKNWDLSTMDDVKPELKNVLLNLDAIVQLVQTEKKLPEGKIERYIVLNQELNEKGEVVTKVARSDNFLQVVPVGFVLALFADKNY